MFAKSRPNISTNVLCKSSRLSSSCHQIKLTSTFIKSCRKSPIPCFTTSRSRNPASYIDRFP
nr:hypothetical protein Iba_chr06aCG10020 [Ipomoea batatas]